MPQKLREGACVAVYLRLFDGFEKRQALIAAHGYPWITRTEQRMVHQQSAQAAIAIHERLEGDEFELDE